MNTETPQSQVDRIKREAEEAAATDAQKILTKLVDRIQASSAAIRATLAKLQTVEQAGYMNGTIVYRDNKYAYLHSPMIDGQRTRKYIGSDPAKIAEAQQMVERFKEREELLSILKRQTQAHNQALERLKEIERRLKDPNAGGWYYAG